MVINRTEPTAQQIEATRKSAALVETLTVERGTYTPRLVVLGSVEPAQDIILSPRVRGQVLELSPSFVPGGMVRKGELLLKLDPADFANALSESESELEQAEASLDVELGRQALARKELELLDDTIDETNRALVLREPQVKSIRAQVKAAEASVARAQLDLDRTSISAPFDAQILRRSVNIGSQVAPGDELAHLVGIDEYWVVASVPVRSLPRLQFGDSGVVGSTVKLHNPNTWPAGTVREGRVARMIGTLDEQTRLARVQIVVSDPLARKTDGPPLILDMLLETHIECRPIENVVRLRREYVHDRDTVWVMKDDKLEIREAVVVFRDAEFAYIQDGLESGEEVVTTTLATVAPGIGLKKANPAAPQSGDPNGETTD